MARKVYITSDISVDEDVDSVAEINPLSALLWPWILTYFDDWGRAEASAKRIKNSVFPSEALGGIVTVELIAMSLQLYHDKGLVTLYTVENKQYMFIDPETWFKWQTHIRKEKRDKDTSKIPSPPVYADCAQMRDDSRDDAHMLEGEVKRADIDTDASRESAQTRANLTDCIPSPSLSLSPSLNISSSGIGEMNPFKLFEGEGFGTISSIIADKLNMLIDDYSERWVCESMKVAVYQGKRSLSYVDGILKRWKSSGIDSPWEAEKEVETAHAKSQASTQGIQHGRDSPASPSDSITNGQLGRIRPNKRNEP